MGDLGVDAADGEVHLGESPSGVVRFLAVDGEVVNEAGVGGDELFALDEHGAGAAAGVVDAAFVGGEHFNQDADDVGGGVELAAFLAFGAGELGEEVFIDVAEHVLGAVGGAAEGDVADEFDELAEPLFVETWAGEVFGEDALQGWVVAFDSDMASSTILPMVGCGALSWRTDQRASLGTQKMLSARYSSGSSGSAPSEVRAASSARFDSKASEMYLRKMRPRTTCLYSAASMLLRRASAAAQSLGSRPSMADCWLGFGEVGGFILRFLEGTKWHVLPLIEGESD